jgi:hypothetical protein
MRRLRPTGIAGIAIFAVLAVTAAGTAIAYFTATGTGSSAAKTIAMLAQPSIATTPGAGGTVALSWGAVAPPGNGTVTYKVERDGGGASSTCAPTLTTTTCIDSGLAVGTYNYVVTAKWRSWTVSSASKAATVTVGPVEQLVLSAASPTPTAGAADNLTITAKDASGSTVTTYAGPKSLTFTGAAASPDGAGPTVSDSTGADVAFGSPTAIDFSAGVATVGSGKNGAMKLYKSGAAGVSVSDGSISTKTSLVVTVSPAAASKFALTAESTGPTVGAANNLTIAARDAYGNATPSYTGSKNLTFSGASASPSGKTPTVANSSGTAINFGSTTSISFTAGVATVISTTNNGVMRLYKSGEAAIAVSDGSVTTKAPLAVTVAPTVASKFVLTAATITPAAGAVDNLTTTAQDEYGNVAISYTGAKTLTFTGASASPNGTVPTVSDSSGAEIAFGSPTAIDFAAGVATVSSGKNGAMKLYKIGSTSLKVGDGSLTTPTGLTVTVAATATRLLLASSATSIAAGGSANLTITALDAFENTVTTYTGSKSLTFTGASASPSGTKPTVVPSSGGAVNFGSATTISFSSGVATVSSSKNGLMKLYDAEEASIVVSDGTISNEAPLTVIVSPVATSKLVLAAATTTPVAGAPDNLTTTAQDTYGNVATAYTGTKSLTFTGASASPSGAVPTVSDSSGADVSFGTATSINFSEGVANTSGTANGVMKLYKSGSTSVKVADSSFSVTLSVTVGSGAATKFLLGSSASALAANGTANLTTTAQDAYGNTATAYTGAKTLTYSGASASPNGTAPTVVDSGNTPIALGSPTAINFTNGVASVASSKNGLLRLYRAESASIAVSDGSISSAAPVAVTVSPATATRWGITNIEISAGTLGSNCLFTCTLTGLGNSGTVKAKVAVTDAYGNRVNAVGSGHAAKVTTSGSGTISGTPLAIPDTGAAESATTFTFTSKSAGNFTETLTVEKSSGTAYTTATLTASR